MTDRGVAEVFLLKTSPITMTSASIRYTILHVTPASDMGRDCGIPSRWPCGNRRSRNPASSRASRENGGVFTSPWSQTRGLSFGLFRAHDMSDRTYGQAGASASNLTRVPAWPGRCDRGDHESLGALRLRGVLRPRTWHGCGRRRLEHVRNDLTGGSIRSAEGLTRIGGAEVHSETTMARVVGMGTGADPASSEANGRPSLYRRRSPRDASEGDVLPA